MKPGGKPGAGAAARPGGGFRQGFGGFNESHLEDRASQAAAKQHQQTQQTTSAAQQTAGAGLGVGASHSALKHQGSRTQTPAKQVKQKAPREVVGLGDGALTEELIKRPVKDVIDEVKAFFDLNAILGINPGDTPEDQAKKKQTLQRWQKLDQEQQQVAQKKYQEEMQNKKQDEEEKAQKKQAEEQQKANSIQAPSSPKKGPKGPGGSKKQRATDKLEQDRKTLGNVAGAN